MKKIVLFLMSIVVLASCTKHEVDYNPASVITDNYNAVFIKTFGQPAANQDWGFASRQLPMLTRGAYPNGNLWEDQGYVLPADITEAEIEKVKKVFAEKGEASYTSLIDLDCFFVQQVYHGDSVYVNGDGGTVTGAEHMDWLCAVTKKHTQVKCWWPYEEEVVEGDEYDDHINNFNAGNCTTTAVSEKTGTPIKGTMLMYNSNTYKFGFKASEDEGNVYYNFRMEKIDGNYYVGFDFEAAGQNPNGQVPRDYVYDDWIVKIVPATGVTPPNRYTVRIICEDLMANGGSDFDFNDVVFDASYQDGVDSTFITVQAAGGVLPLFVEGHEIHKLFAEANPNDNSLRWSEQFSNNTMINTNASNGVSGLNPVTFRIEGIKAPWDIEIVVVRNGDVMIPLKAEVGSPAAKIAVDPTFVWCNERDDIREIYPDFPLYVKDTSVNWY